MARRRAAQPDPSPPPRAGLPLQHSTAPPHRLCPGGAGGTPPRLSQPRGGESLPQDAAGGCKLTPHALRCIALHCIALHCIAFYCIAFYCIALYCIANSAHLRIPKTCTPPRSPRGWPCPGAQSSEAAASSCSSHHPPLPIAAATTATAAGKGRCPPHRARPLYMLSCRPRPAPPRRGLGHTLTRSHTHTLPR